MRILHHFEYRDNIILTAAQVGVSKWKWNFVNHDQNLDAAKKYMQEKEYDVLPIKSEDGEFTSFYSTWNQGDYNQLNKIDIDKSRRIYYKMSFRDLIKKFAETKSLYFFLETHDEVVGLVSSVNFNSLPVYNYMYREIADVEYRVSQFLEDTLEEKVVLDILLNASDNKANKLGRDYMEAQKNQRNNNILQHLYLSNLGLIIDKSHQNFEPKYRSLNSYSRAFQNKYRELRNIVAHPVRPIIEDHDSFVSISKILTDFDDIRDLLAQ